MDEKQIDWIAGTEIAALMRHLGLAVRPHSRKKWIKEAEWAFAQDIIRQYVRESIQRALEEKANETAVHDS